MSKTSDMIVVLIVYVVFWMLFFTVLDRVGSRQDAVPSEADKRSVISKLHDCGRKEGGQVVVDDCYEEVLYGEKGPF